MAVVWTVEGEAGKAMDATNRELAAAGWTDGLLTLRSLDVDELTFTVHLDSPAGTGAVLPEPGQMVILKRSGTVVFRGHVTRQKYTTAARMGVDCTVSGPWWWLANRDISQEQTAGATTKDRQQFVFGATGSKNLAAHVDTLFARAGAVGLPVALDSGWSTSKFFEWPQITRSVTSFAETLAEILLPIADVVTWWDYTQTPPEFHAERRGDLSAQTYTVGTAPLLNAELNPRVELEVSEVIVSSVQRNATTGATEFAEEKSGAGSKPQILTVSGPELTDQLPNELFRSFDIITETHSEWFEVVRKHVEAWADAEARHGAPDAARTLTISSLTGTTTLTDEGGNDYELPQSKVEHARTLALEIDFADVDIIVKRGLRPPAWLEDENTPRVERLNLELFYALRLPYYEIDRDDWDKEVAEFSSPIAEKTPPSGPSSYVNQSGIIDNAETTFTRWNFGKLTFTVWTTATAYPTLTTLYEEASWDFIAPPAGLAANLLGTQNFLPYDGIINLYEDEAGAANLMARKYNVAGALSAHATAGALPKEVQLGLNTGHTHIALGAPARFDYQSLVQRIRRTSQDNIVQL